MSSKRTIQIVSVLALLATLTPSVRGHEVPNEVTVFGFVRPQGQTLTLLLRAPLKAMRDIEVPTVPGDFIDFTRIERALNDAATLWIVD